MERGRRDFRIRLAGDLLMTRSLPRGYVPGVPPVDFKDWPRWIDWELNQIADRFNQPTVALAVTGSETIAISPVLNTITLGIDDVPNIDNQGGWDPITGTYTVPQSGLWDGAVNASISAFGLGNKTYFALLEILVNGVVRAETTDGGSDDVPLGVSLTGPLILLQGDQVIIHLSTLHETFTGVSDVFYNFSYIRSGD